MHQERKDIEFVQSVCVVKIIAVDSLPFFHCCFVASVYCKIIAFCSNFSIALHFCFGRVPNLRRGAQYRYIPDVAIKIG